MEMQIIHKNQFKRQNERRKALLNYSDILQIRRSPSKNDQIENEAKENMEKSRQGFKIINELNEGEYFGEIGLLSNLRRTCSIYTISKCFCAVLSKSSFHDLV